MRPENPVEPAAARRGRAKPQTDLEHLIFRRVGQAIGDHGLIVPGDRILVAVSGGKDSFALLHTLELHRRRSPFPFELLPVFVDAGWGEGVGERVAERMAGVGLPVEVMPREIRRCVEEKLRPGSNPCALCSRLRRGFLYDLAPRLGCNKIALGHHLDDLLETLLLNLFFSGQLKSMAVHLTSDDGRNRVIRPLAYVEAERLVEFSRQRGFVPVEIDCPYRAAGADPHRAVIHDLIDSLSGRFPRLRRSMLAAMKHVRPSHLLGPRPAGN